jgi:hypothetical protein
MRARNKTPENLGLSVFICGLIAIRRIIGFDRGWIVRDIILLAVEAFGAGCQSSSGVEQRTHKPLVGGSNPSSGTNF